MSGTEKIINIDDLPSPIGRPRVDFDNVDFDVLLSQKGLEVIYEQALICPCKSQGGDHLSSCKNCGGLGFIYINPTKTRMVLQSMNNQSNKQPWSIEMSGTVSITARAKFQFADMDKIIVNDSTSVCNQIIHPKVFDGALFGYLIYRVIEIEQVFAFKSPDAPLVALEEGVNYILDNDVLLFKDNILLNGDIPTIAVRYKHKPQFHVIDIPKDIRRSYKINTAGADKNISLPIMAIGRRSHYVIDIPNSLSSFAIFDNSPDTVADGVVRHDVTTSTIGDGNGTINSNPEVLTGIMSGITVSLNATPNSGSVFVRWIIDGEDYFNPIYSAIIGNNIDAVVEFQVLP